MSTRSEPLSEPLGTTRQGITGTGFPPIRGTGTGARLWHGQDNATWLLAGHFYLAPAHQNPVYVSLVAEIWLQHSQDSMVIGVSRDAQGVAPGRIRDRNATTVRTVTTNVLRMEPWPVITFRCFSHEDHQAVTSRAQSLGLSMSDYLRTLVAKDLERVRMGSELGGSDSSPGTGIPAPSDRRG